MKRLLALVGAAATACGLYAADYAISFEAAESDQGVDAEAMTFTPGEGWGWEDGATLPLAAYDGDAYVYGTESYARRDVKFKNEDAQFNYLKLDTGTNALVREVDGSIYLDQLVKFTGFEEVQTNLVEGTKIAVWMSEFTEEDNTTSTNLYVTCAKVNDRSVAEPIALKIDGDYRLGAWYRLTIKSIGNIFGSSLEYTPRAGFIIYIDGKLVSSSDPEAANLIKTIDQMPEKNKDYMGRGQLFPAIDNANAEFKQVAYQGIGSVDDIIIDSDGPAFCVNEDFTFTIGNVENAEVAEVVANGITLAADPEGKYTVQANAQVVIYFKAFDGYKLKTDTMEVTIAADGQEVDPSETIEAVPVVAVLNDEKELAEFELSGAFDDLEVGDQIEIRDYCAIWDYSMSFTPNTIVDVTEEGWEIAVGSYDGCEGGLEVFTGIAEDFSMIVEFAEDFPGLVAYAGDVLGTLEVLNGSIEVTDNIEIQQGASIKAVEIDLEANEVMVALSEGAKLISTDGCLDEGRFELPENYELSVSDPDEDGYYTYTAKSSEPEPTTYSITYHDYGEWADGFEPVTEYTEETDTFALPVAENIAPRMGGEFQGWTNAVGAIVSEVEKGSEGDLNFYAVWKTAGTDEVAEEIAEKIETEGMSEDEQKTVRDNIIELNEVCGGIDAAKSWIANVYGEGAKIPGAKLVATTPELINIAAKYDLPIMTTEVAVEVAQAAEVGSFTFKLKDGVEDISIARAKIEEMIQYSADLVNFAVNKEQIEVVVDKDNCTMKATFKKSAVEAKGFMKLVLEADK